MRKLVFILNLVLILTHCCFGADVLTTHQHPTTDSALDIGSASLLWRYIYGDSFTDGTALWDGRSLSGFLSIEGTTLTDGTFIITGGYVTTGEWRGTDIDISDYTNLIGGVNITLSNDTLNVDDAFLVNDASDTTTGTITAAGFTTTGTLIVDTDTLTANISGYANKVGIGTATPSGVLTVDEGSSHFTVRDDTFGNTILGASGNAIISIDSDNDESNRSFVVTLDSETATGTQLFRVQEDGDTGVGTSTPTAKFDINSDILRLRTAKTPASVGSDGNAGDICWDTSYVYVCVANNSWKRAALTAWEVTDVLLLDDGASKLFLDDGSSYLLIRP